MIDDAAVIDGGGLQPYRSGSNERRVAASPPGKGNLLKSPPPASGCASKVQYA